MSLKIISVKLKWNDMPLNLKKEDRELFRFFLYNNRTLKLRELNAISKTLRILKQHNKDAYFRLILSFHYIRLWRNMSLTYKILNLHLLYHVKFLAEMRRRYLV